MSSTPPRRPRGRPRINVDIESGAISNIFSLSGRPVLRWLTLAIICLILWLSSPSLIDLVQPQHRYNYVPPPLHLPNTGGNSSRPLQPPVKQPGAQTALWSSRASRVRNAFVHAFEGYQKHALPYDQLLPVSGKKTNNLNGWGLTLFDSLDTMWIMNLTDTFNDALQVVAQSSFVTKKGEFVQFFETVIRYLGGLLSAYTLSHEPILLSRADDLAAMLLPAFNTTTGFPMYAVNTVTGETRKGWSGNVLWAEALSNQVEFKYLAHLTGRMEYFEKTERIMRHMYTANVTEDMFPTMWSEETGRPANEHFSVGAYADSAHEYLLKQWLLTGQTEPQSRELYLRSMHSVIEHLLYLTPRRHLLYVTDTYNGHPTHRFEHLSCFLPGLLALGIHTLQLPKHDEELHMWAAEGLARTCWATYLDMETGLGADEVSMNMTGWGQAGAQQGLWMKSLKQWEAKGRPGNGPPGTGELKKEGKDERDYILGTSSYLLRPETVESFYILWRTTGDEKWRERGWLIFEAIEKHARTEFGYASIFNVNSVPATLLDEMPSYFLAETLKYLYLLFTDEDILPLDDWVFNTEAHPLPVFVWRDWEKHKYGISL